MAFSKRLALLVALALALIGTASRELSADAQPTPTASEALDVSADRLDLDVQAKTAVLTGSVRLAKGNVSVRCPRVDARYDDAAKITWAKGSGGVIAELGGARAEAPEVEIDMQQKTLELRGGVRITRGAGFLTADRATMNMATSKITMSDVKGSVPVGGKPSP